MTVVINPYDRHVAEGTIADSQTLTQSTATLPQGISIMHGLTTLSGGTATGFARDLYVLRATTTATATGAHLGQAVEGMVKTILMLGTGEAKIQVDSWATTRIAAGLGWAASAATDF